VGKAATTVERPKRTPTISVFYNEQWVLFDSIPQDAQRRVRERATEIWQAATQQQIKLMMERARARANG